MLPLRCDRRQCVPNGRPIRWRQASGADGSASRGRAMPLLERPVQTEGGGLLVLHMPTLGRGHATRLGSHWQRQVAHTSTLAVPQAAGGCRRQSILDSDTRRVKRGGTVHSRLRWLSLARSALATHRVKRRLVLLLLATPGFDLDGQVGVVREFFDDRYRLWTFGLLQVA